MPLCYRFNPWHRTLKPLPPKAPPEPPPDPRDGIDWRPRTLHHFRQRPADQARRNRPWNSAQFLWELQR